MIWRWEWLQKGTRRVVCGDVLYLDLYLDCINGNTQVVIVYYRFIKCYHWGKLGKGHKGSLFLTSQQLYVNLQLPQSQNFNF